MHEQKPSTHVNSLHLATFANSIRCVQYLLATKAFAINAFDAQGKSAVHLDAGAHPDNIRTIPAPLVPPLKSKDAIEALLRNGANVNCLSVQRLTPLHLAAAGCEKGYRALEMNPFESNPNGLASKEIALILLRAGANPEAIGAAGCSPLFIAQAYRNTLVEEIFNQTCA